MILVRSSHRMVLSSGWLQQLQQMNSRKVLNLQNTVEYDCSSGCNVSRSLEYLPYSNPKVLYVERIQYPAFALAVPRFVDAADEHWWQSHSWTRQIYNDQLRICNIHQQQPDAAAVVH